jgi:hypothetical protein
VGELCTPYGNHSFDPCPFDEPLCVSADKRKKGRKPVYRFLFLFWGMLEERGEQVVVAGLVRRIK